MATRAVFCSCFVAVVVVCVGCVATLLVADHRGGPGLRAAWQRLPSASFVTGATVLVDNGDAWAARWEILSGAREEIDASYFIVEDDVIGLAFLGKLLERAEHGVRVRLLLDARGSSVLVGDDFDFLQELVQSGAVDVRVFNPVLPQVVRALLERNVVPIASGTHNKILAVDGQVAITGGRNVGAVYAVAIDESASAVSDADVLVDGAGAVAALVDGEFAADARDNVVADIVNIVPRRDELLLLAAAMDAWLGGDVACDAREDTLVDSAVAATGVVDLAAVDAARSRIAVLVTLPSLCARLPLSMSKRVEVEAAVVAGRSRAEAVDNDVGAALVGAIDAADDSIVFESPYFILTQPLLRALEDAGRRGVVITLLTNSPLSSDNALSQALFIDSWPEIMARVPTLRVFVVAGTQMQHGKRAVFDDVLSFIGSNNLDPFSLHVNSETLLAAWSAELAAQMRTELEARTSTMIEYRVARDVFGVARRDVSAAPNTGAVVVERGPGDHVPVELLLRLRALKLLLLAQRRLWDFEVVVW